ncbi:MAG: hypothetical protein V1661_01135 [bacterium]
MEKFPSKIEQPRRAEEERNGNIEAAILSYLEEEKQDSPIRPGEKFNPETERQKLWKLQGEERAAALEEYKEKLAFQKEGLAMMQSELIRKIDKNPDLSAEEAGDFVKEFIKNYGLTRGQVMTAGRIFSAYQKKHAAVEKIFSEHPDVQDLYATLFGAKPKGKIEIIKDPMTLYFRCYNPEDYARIYFQQKLIAEGERPLTQAEIKKIKGHGGASIGVARIAELNGTLIAENAKGRPFDEKSLDTHIHEKQHAMQRLLTEEGNDDFLYIDIEAGDGEEKINAEFRKHIETTKANIEEMAKQEILAYIRGGQIVSEGRGEVIMEKLLKKKESGGTYDYFSEDRGRVLEVQEELCAKGDITMPKERLKQIVEKALDEIYDKKKYEQTVKRGIGAFIKLWRGFKEGSAADYYMEKIIAFLAREPLWKWPSVARRLLEYKINSQGFTEQEERWFKK